MGDPAPANTSSQHAGLLGRATTAVRRRPYLLLLILVLTPPFWTLVFFAMPVIIAGVVLVAGFVILDQASQKPASTEEGIGKATNGERQESTLTTGPAAGDREQMGSPSKLGSGLLSETARSDETNDASLTSAALDPKPAHATTTLPSGVTSAGKSEQSPPPLPEQKPVADQVSHVLSGPVPKAIETQAPSAPAPMTGPAMLARAAALRKSKLEAAAKSSGEILFLYGSQTGNAMEVAKSLNAEVSDDFVGMAWSRHQGDLKSGLKYLRALWSCQVALLRPMRKRVYRR